MKIGPWQTQFLRCATITFSMGCYFKGPVGVDNPTIINKLKQSQKIKQDNNKLLNQEYLQFYVVLTRPVWMKKEEREGENSTEVGSNLTLNFYTNSTSFTHHSYNPDAGQLPRFLKLYLSVQKRVQRGL